MRSKLQVTPTEDLAQKDQVASAQDHAIPAPPDRLARRRWAILIRRVYQADPLRCPRCGGTMKIIAFIEAHQQAVIGKILQHCGLPPEGPKGWVDPPSRSPPKPACPPSGPKPGRQGVTAVLIV